MQIRKKEYEELQTNKQAYKIALQNTINALQVVVIEDPEHKYREFLEQMMEQGRHAITYGKLP
ncbi:hypothetical protein phiV141_49 [Vibrio phage phiV141]|uniref:Uncharacterized protein n=1 Tax=Vibrio phage phiV141 TaxID=2723905 RepID=A0A7D7ITE9_9CAUD|nr:hypothetical protein phiV141_49 [Vibrio phage phiV141]